MNVVEFKGSDHKGNVYKMLKDANALVDESGYDQGIVILFDRSGKTAQYLMSHHNSIAAVGWLEVLKQINLDVVMSDD